MKKNFALFEGRRKDAVSQVDLFAVTAHPFQDVGVNHEIPRRREDLPAEHADKAAAPLDVAGLPLQRFFAQFFQITASPFDVIFIGSPRKHRALVQRDRLKDEVVLNLPAHVAVAEGERGIDARKILERPVKPK